MALQVRARLCSLLLLLGLAVPAAASEWWYVNSGAGRVLLVDAKSIERRKDIVTYWTMSVIRTDEPEGMTKTQMKANCVKRTLGPLAGIRYDRQGRAMGSLANVSGPMEPVAPDTLGDAQLQFACGDEGHRVANDLFPLAIDAVTFADALLARGGGNAEDAHALHDRLAGRPATPMPTAQPPAEAAEPRQAIVAMPLESQSGEAEKLEGHCRDGDAHACTSLGTLLAEGDGVARDPQRAATLFAQACAKKVAEACTSLGLAYHEGKGVSADEREAAAAFAQACALGRPTYCANIGLAYATGNGVEKDIGRARLYLDAACRDGSAGACSNLGASYSLEASGAHDQRRARKLFARACDGDDAGGCYNLGVLYDQGLGMRKDPKRAAPLYERACAADHASACGNLAMLVQSGTGVAQNAARAAELFDKGCRLGNAEACLNLGHVYRAGAGVARDKTRAADYYRQALALDRENSAARRALAALDP